MFHSDCVTKWLEIHNTCPLCRFELPTDDPNYERERKERNNQRNANMARNPNVRAADLNHPENMNPQPQPQPGSRNQNINIQGENNINGL